LGTKETLRRVFDFSYGRSYAEHLQARFESLANEKYRDIKPEFLIDSEVLIAKLEEVFGQDFSPRDAQIVWENGFYKLIEHKSGVRIDFEKLIDELTVKIGSGEVPDKFVLAFEAENPEYLLENAALDLVILERFLSEDLVFQDENFQIEKRLDFDPNLISVRFGEIQVNKDYLSEFLRKNLWEDFQGLRKDMVILAVPLEGVGKAFLEGDSLSDGLWFDFDILVERVLLGLPQENFVFDLELKNEAPRLINKTGLEIPDLSLLAVGKSDFKSSDAGREKNIRRAANEKFDFVWVPAGEVFEFNSLLGAVTLENGWFEALGIFNGDQLRMTPGGGICQVSTTFYRAALAAGLEIVERSPHSLYVKYYRLHGNGLDAAIYPGIKDLKFRNNTFSPMLLHAKVLGDELYVEVYGVSDGRKVELFGPFFSDSRDEILKGKKNIGRNAIAWIQRITKDDGEVVENFIYSTYKNSIVR
jgi:vancomycin resistance protein YoaR